MKRFITNWLRQRRPKVQLLFTAGTAKSRCSLMSRICFLSSLITTLLRFGFICRQALPLYWQKRPYPRLRWCQFSKVNGKKASIFSGLPEECLGLIPRSALIVWPSLNRSQWPGMRCADQPDQSQEPRLKWERSRSPEEMWGAPTSEGGAWEYRQNQSMFTHYRYFSIFLLWYQLSSPWNNYWQKRFTWISCLVGSPSGLTDPSSSLLLTPGDPGPVSLCGICIYPSLPSKNEHQKGRWS